MQLWCPTTKVLLVLPCSQEEYDELLKYAVVIPEYNPTNLRSRLADTRGAFSREDDIVTIQASQQSALIHGEWPLEFV